MNLGLWVSDFHTTSSADHRPMTSIPTSSIFFHLNRMSKRVSFIQSTIKRAHI